MKKSVFIVIVLISTQLFSQENCLHFDGSDDYVEGPIAGLPLGSAARTVEFWFNTSTSPGIDEYFVSWGSKSTNNSFAVGMFSSGQLAFTQDGSSFSSGSAYNDGIWHHCAVTFDGSSVIMYVDGSVVNSGTFTINTSGSNFRIGGYVESATQFINASIDEVRIWDSALTHCVINANMNVGVDGTESGLVAAFNFDQGTDCGSNGAFSTVTDLAGGDNNGTCTNMALSGCTSNYLTSGVSFFGTYNSSPAEPVAVASASDSTICEGSSTDLSATGGASYTWDNGLGSGSAHTVSPTITTVYTVTVTNADGCTADDDVTINVDTMVNAGTDGTHDFCSTGGSADIFADLTDADTGGVWEPVLTSGSGVFDPSTDTAGTYQYIVDGGACPNDTSEVTVSVVEAVNAGTSTSLDLCSSDDSLDLTTVLGTTDTLGTWSPVLSSGSNYFHPSVDTTATYTYTVLGTSPCPDDIADITITVTTASFAGSDTSHGFCMDSGAADLFLDLTGADSGGVWSPAMTSGTGVFDPTVDPSGVYIYTVSGTGPCPDVSANVVVSVYAPPNPGSDGSHAFCDIDSPYDLFDDLGFANVGGSWSPALTSGTGVFDPVVDPPGDYTYTVSGLGGCPDSSATISVTVSAMNFAGEDSVHITCENTGTLNLFDFLSFDADLGGDWSDDEGTGALSGSIFTLSDVAFPASYSFTYHQDNAAPCEDDSAIITITIIDCSDMEEQETTAMKLYPNPVTDKLNVDPGSLFIEKMELYSSLGKKVKSTVESEMNLTDLKKGNYILLVFTVDKIYSFRINKI